MEYVLFLLAFIAVADWTQIWLFASALLRPNIKKKKITNKDLSALVEAKAGFELKDIVVIESDKMYGGMSGVPGRPLMMLSATLLKNLTKDELEYVILHEAAHFKYFHPIIAAVSQILFILFGFYVLSFTTTFVSIFIGIFLGIVFIYTVARTTERAAENFAAANMKNPKAMLTAVNKFEEKWQKSSLHFLKPFGWNIPYEEKRKIAKALL